MDDILQNNPLSSEYGKRINDRHFFINKLKTTIYDADEPNADEVSSIESEEEDIGAAEYTKEQQSYNELQNVLRGADYTKEDTYKQLMATEKNVLKSVDKVINYEKKKKLVEEDILQMSLVTIGKHIIVAIKELIEFVTENDNITMDNFILFLQVKNRTIFLGIAISIVSILFLLVS